MPRIPLLGGAYSAESLIANAQRSVNLYPEKNPDDSQAPVNVTHYPRPGLRLLSSPPSHGRGRCLFAETDGHVIVAIDNTVYFVDSDFVWHQVGTFLASTTNPVYMADNGTNTLIVDGSTNGYNLDSATHLVTQIGDPNFLGGDRCDFLDGFFIVNQPNTPNWYCSDLYSITFNALSFGTKTAWPDNITSLIAIERLAWIFGQYKGEVWWNSGASPFPFEISPGVIIEHGASAPYSVAKQDINVYWLSQSPEGARMAMKGYQNTAVRISNHAVENEWRKYLKVSDAIGGCYQVNGHAFYAIHFPTADRTWVYDDATHLWYEDAYFDGNGVQHRSRASFYAYSYGRNLALDWATGDLYELTPDVFADAGTPIQCVRSLPHLLDEEDDRVTYWRLIADIESGSDPSVPNPQISLRMSRDRGGSYGNKVLQPYGGVGQYATRPTWNRLGYAADMVFELSFELERKTALNGVFVVTEKHEADSS